MIHRVGSTAAIPVDFRLVGATNEDLEARVARGLFREDLFYRLNVFPIRVPPLRERASDIALLAEYFRERFGRENGFDPPRIPIAMLNRMISYEWPGNVRELENFIERAIILNAGAAQLLFEPPSGRHRTEVDLVDEATRESWTLDRLEKEYILSVLEQTGGHRGRAAEILGIDRRTLYRKLKTNRAPAGCAT